jgi:protein disulfide-isomerase A6
MHSHSISGAALAVAILSVLPGAQAGFYTKNSPVIQLDGKNYDRVVAKSNYTTVSPSPASPHLHHP